MFSVNVMVICSLFIPCIYLTILLCMVLYFFGIYKIKICYILSTSRYIKSWLNSVDQLLSTFNSNALSQFKRCWSRINQKWCPKNKQSKHSCDLCEKLSVCVCVCQEITASEVGVCQLSCSVSRWRGKSIDNTAGLVLHHSYWSLGSLT